MKIGIRMRRINYPIADILRIHPGTGNIGHGEPKIRRRIDSPFCGYKPPALFIFAAVRKRSEQAPLNRIRFDAVKVAEEQIAFHQPTPGSRNNCG